MINSVVLSERDETLRILSLLKPFQKPSPYYFYLDIVLTSIIGWGGLFLFAQRAFDNFSVILFVITYLAFFRGLAFIHEVVHFQKKLKGLKTLYNLFFGFPNRVPLYIHEPHQFHHLPTTFGTSKDPEYLYLKGKGLWYLAFPFVSAPLLPLLLLLRFGTLPVFSMLMPFHVREKLFSHYSTVVVNPKYIRQIKSKDCLRKALKQDLACSIYFFLFLSGFLFGLLSISFFVSWYVLLVMVGLVNIFRARLAHRYDNHFDRLTPFAQIRDSVTIEGSILSVFWAPLGLKFHSLHHLAPQIPYHNLAKAHAFLKSNLEYGHPYQKTILPNFVAGLRQFICTIKG